MIMSTSASLRTTRFPTAIHISSRVAIQEELDPCARAYAREHWLTRRRLFDGVMKSGRTHLMDATPVRLGQGVRRICDTAFKGNHPCVCSR